MGIIARGRKLMLGENWQQTRHEMQHAMTKILSCALLALCCLYDSAAATPLDEAWRAELRQVRKLAENDAPRAYAEAQRLQASMSAAAAPVDQAAMLNLLARTELHMSLNAQAEGHARQALKIAQASGDRVGQAEADLNLAIILVYLGTLDDLSAVTTHALSVLDGMDKPDLLGEALLRASMMYRRIGLLDESITMAMQAAEIARRSNNPLVLAYAEQGLAISYSQNNRSAEAIEHYAKMREQARLAQSKWLEAEAVLGLSMIANTNGDVHHAEKIAREGLALYREFGAPFGISFAQFHVAENLRQQGRYAEAHRQYDEVITADEKYSIRIALWYALNSRSKLHQLMGDKPSSWADAERAYALAKDITFPAYIGESARHIATLYAAKGDTDKAYALLLEAENMQVKLTQEKNSTRMLQLAEKYQKESKLREIRELTSLNQLKEEELENNALERRWLLTTLIGGLVIMIIAALFILRLHRTRNKIRALNASLEQRVQERTFELHQQARYLQTLIDTLSLPIWFKDTRGRFLAINRVCATACGSTPEAMVGKSDFGFMPAAFAQAARNADAEVMDTRRQKVVEEFIQDGQGGFYLETTKSPVLDEDERVLGTVGFSRNISAQKVLEEARETALQEAKHLAQSRSDFMAQMSHELRTPLNGILGYTQNMLRDEALSEQQIERLNIILQSGDHLLALINDILDHARIDAGRFELIPGEITLHSFFNTIVAIIRVRAEQKGITFVFEAAADMPAVILGDAQRLRQVVLNLLSNAVKFTDHGQVTLRADFAFPARLHITVQDSGVGIATEQLEAIFQPFVQVGERSRRAAGSGLGLAISQPLVRLMGGDIEVESKLGAGSTFSFAVDAEVVQAEAATKDATPIQVAPNPPARLKAALLAPPEHELEALHALARRGNMRKVVQYAEHLDELDKAYLPFTEQLRLLAKGYQSQGILSLVERCMEEGVK